MSACLLLVVGWPDDMSWRGWTEQVLEPQRSTGSDASDASGGGGGSGGLVLVQAEPLSESSALPRLEQQTITTLHNLSEVKGQFFEKMWLHFAAKWSPWMSKTYKNGIGSDAESKRRKQATTDTIEHMRAASDEDTDLAISATIKGKKAHLLRHLILQTNDHFTKTGSGPT
jgi:hypothetical protein